MPTINEIAQQLAGEIPSLPALLARKYVDQALEEIKKDFLWTWNTQSGMLLCPAQITGGYVSVTQWSNTITFDAVAQALLLPWVLSQAQPLLSRQFRVSGGPIYSLIGYDPGTGVATLDRIYTETTAPTSAYQVYQCYYGPPTVDGVTPNYNFLRYLSILNPIQGYTLRGKRLYWTRAQLDFCDPMRGAVGSPYFAAQWKPTPIAMVNGQLPNGPTNGFMLTELWPHPTYQVGLQCQFECGHVPLGPNEYLPAQACAVLVRYRAMEFGYRWAATNAGRLPELKGNNWYNLLADIQRKYTAELVTAKKNDKEISPQIIQMGSGGSINGLWGPIDSNFAQSHDYPSGFPNSWV